MTKPSDHALKFEAVKTALRQDKAGYTLVLSIHPDDVPEALMRDWVGQRYMCVMVGIGDDEKPVERKPQNDLVRYAGELCREPEFQYWLRNHISYAVEMSDDAWEHPEERTKIMLRRDLGIASRRELADNKKAIERFHALVQQYLAETANS